MHIDLDLLALNGIVAAPAFDPGLISLVEAAPVPSHRPPAAGLPEPALDRADPHLAAYWMWTHGAAAPDMARDEMPNEYVAAVAARCGRDFVEGTDYLTEVQLREHLRAGGANDNWLMRRVK